MKQIYRLLWHLTFEKFLYFRAKYKGWGKRNKIIVVTQNGEKKEVSQYTKIKGLRIDFCGNDNVVEINENVKFNNSIFCFQGNNNYIKFGSNVRGRYVIFIFENKSYFEVGENTSCCDMGVNLISNKVIIGKDCMFSNNIVIWGDGHSVLDAMTEEVINIPEKTLTIGDHVWIGERVTLLKNAKIPNNCIIGIASVVTKAFDEENCLIAGNPAKVCKKNINWNGASPLTYKKN